MIISASYHTDIAASYGNWFMHRLKEGYCVIPDPVSGTARRISLRPKDIDGIVFWTRKLSPFSKALHEIYLQHLPFTVQYSICNYPKELESEMPAADEAIAQIDHLRRQYGPDVPVWHYSPVIISSVSDYEYHLRHFEELAMALKGKVNEVVVSFYEAHTHSDANLSQHLKAQQVQLFTAEKQDKEMLIRKMLEIADSARMTLSLCQSQQFEHQAATARCIDAARLSRVAGKEIAAKANKTGMNCACHHAVDIGIKESCPLGCQFCFSVQSHHAAARFKKAHDPQSESLYQGTFKEKGDGGDEQDQLFLDFD